MGCGSIAVSSSLLLLTGRSCNHRRERRWRRCFCCDSWKGSISKDGARSSANTTSNPTGLLYRRCNWPCRHNGFSHLIPCKTIREETIHRTLEPCAKTGSVVEDCGSGVVNCRRLRNSNSNWSRRTGMDHFLGVGSEGGGGRTVGPI